jgi:hypothetical protein
MKEEDEKDMTANVCREQWGQIRICRERKKMDQEELWKLNRMHLKGALPFAESVMGVWSTVVDHVNRSFLLFSSEMWNWSKIPYNQNKERTFKTKNQNHIPPSPSSAKTESNNTPAAQTFNKFALCSSSSSCVCTVLLYSVANSSSFVFRGQRSGS